MPQMHPMNWLFISITTICICLTLMSILYFSINSNPKSNPQFKNIKKINMKYMW